MTDSDRTVVVEALGDRAWARLRDEHEADLERIVAGEVLDPPRLRHAVLMACHCCLAKIKLDRHKADHPEDSDDQ